jgi:DNA modification methylase
VQLNTASKTLEMTEVELEDKIQFVYEIAFAKREIRGILGSDPIVRLDDKIRFELPPLRPDDKDALLKRLAHFKKIGNSQTQYSKIVSRYRKKSQSDNQYLTHWFYPYKGKYHPRLVRSIFNIIEMKYGETVLDPFIGSGTTTLEAHLYGLNSIGVDVSPVCTLISKVKVSCGQVAQKLDSYAKDAIKAMKHDFEASKARSSKNTSLIETFEPNKYFKFLNSIKNVDVRNFYQVAQLIFASDRGRRQRTFDTFEKNLGLMIRSALDLAEVEHEIEPETPLGSVKIERGDARKLKIPDESIDGIVCSPPYSIALNYMENDKYALEELGIDIKKLSSDCIGVKGNKDTKCELYVEDMKRCYDEMYRVLKNGKQCVVVIGNAKVDGEPTKTVDDAIDYCQSIGFTKVDDLPKIIFGLYNTINEERVLFFKKE